ncbi:hypothetical protein LCGC14_1051710 [marine sediment metagenome]|uniref:Uncharacterized protein n=1 Tax=marine sediment metagenome TaxID=412755 RepID=A0A0F9NAG2_9ZZZZ
MNAVTVLILGAVLFAVALAFNEAMPELRELMELAEHWERAGG